MTENRKLAAIVFTDIVGFTELMGRDEASAMALLDKQRRLLRPIVENFEGEWLKELGDGLLFSFPSAVKAVTCSLEIQRILEHDPKLNLRVGIHIGDVIKKGGDVFGDGVNIASRLESLAEPGGICVSERVQEDIKNKPEIHAKFQEEQLLKGVDKPIKVYSIFTKMGSFEDRSPDATPQKSNLLIPVLMSVIILLGILGLVSFYFDKDVIVKDAVPVVTNKAEIHPKSIAVLPFDNYSNAEEDQYFSDGLTEVIIANLVKIRELKVISRTSVMQYKGTTKPLKEIGKELGVAYILEGSVQRGKNRIRIVGQLIDTKTDEHLWAETYDREIEDLFDIQINVAKTIAEVLKIEMSSDEISSLNKAPTDNLEAWDYFLKGMNYSKKSYSKEDVEKGLYYFQKASELDSDIEELKAVICRLHLFMYWAGYDRTEQRLQMAKTALDKAMQIDPENAEVRIARGYYYYYGFRDYLRAIEDFKFALDKMPGNKTYNEHIAYIERRIGRFNDAIINLKIAFENDPKNAILAFGIGETYEWLYDFDNAEYYYNTALETSPDAVDYYSNLARNKFFQGKASESLKIIDGALAAFSTNRLLNEKIYLQYLLRDFDNALNTIQSLNVKIYIDQQSYKPVESLKGVNYYHKGDLEKAMDNFRIAEKILEKTLREITDDPRIYSEYGMVLAYLGKKEAAVKAAETAVSLVPIEKDAIAGVWLYTLLTKILAIAGDPDRAIKELAYLRTLPGGPPTELLKHDPVWDPLRNLPDFQSILKQEFKTKIF